MMGPDSDPKAAGFYQRILLDRPSVGFASPEEQDKAVERLTDVIRELHEDTAGTDDFSNRLQQKLAERKIGAVHSLVAADPDEWLDRYARDIVRVIVRESARPGLPLDMGVPTVFDPSDFWTGPLREVIASNGLPSLACAVGRIDVGDTAVGTGVLVADDRVITNYHVVSHAAAIKARCPESMMTIDFSDRPASNLDKRFSILREIEQPPNVRQMQRKQLLDVAALVVAKNSLNGSANLPTPATVATRPIGGHDRGCVGVIGYPDRPMQSSLTAPAYAAAIKNFIHFRVKTFSPGQIIAGLDESEDATHLTFLHDTSTLPGSSGSVVIRLADRLEVVGLHRSGVWFKHNRAHCLSSVRSVAPELFA